MMTAGAIIRTLGLEPHPEGGHFKEIYRHAADDGGRGVATSIYFLLREGEVSAWHRVDAVEIWNFHAGAPLKLSISENEKDVSDHILGVDLTKGERPQAVVPAHAWQAARSLGAWTLVGCTVAPAFDFAGFEMAPSEWLPK